MSKARENAQFGQHEHGQNVSDLISPIENIQFLRLKIIAPGVGTIWVGNVGRGRIGGLGGLRRQSLIYNYTMLVLYHTW